ncbi:hypothetical protein MIR68_007693 [Amoeboaphelidium protococcarum]|nr:hypothetical protein MIR68_007693 [Amoeboaphelidium protococcarum]
MKSNLTLLYAFLAVITLNAGIFTYATNALKFKDCAALRAVLVSNRVKYIGSGTYGRTYKVGTQYAIKVNSIQFGDNNNIDDDEYDDYKRYSFQHEILINFELTRLRDLTPNFVALLDTFICQRPTKLGPVQNGMYAMMEYLDGSMQGYFEHLDIQRVLPAMSSMLLQLFAAFDIAYHHLRFVQADMNPRNLMTKLLPSGQGGEAPSPFVSNSGTKCFHLVTFTDILIPADLTDNRMAKIIDFGDSQIQMNKKIVASNSAHSMKELPKDFNARFAMLAMIYSISYDQLKELSDDPAHRIYFSLFQSLAEIVLSISDSQLYGACIVGDEYNVLTFRDALDNEYRNHCIREAIMNQKVFDKRPLQWAYLYNHPFFAQSHSQSQCQQIIPIGDLSQIHREFNVGGLGGFNHRFDAIRGDSLDSSYSSLSRTSSDQEQQRRIIRLPGRLEYRLTSSMDDISELMDIDTDSQVEVDADHRYFM